MPNKSADLPTITIAKFENALHERSAFSCGFAPIDNFLKSSLSEQIKDGMVAAWMATAEGQNAVLGFYTLGAMAVRAQFGPKKWQRASRSSSASSRSSWALLPRAVPGSVACSASSGSNSGPIP